MQTRMLHSDSANLAAPTVLLSNVSLTRYGPNRPTRMVSLSLHFHKCYVYLDSFFTAGLFPSLRALAAKTTSSGHSRSRGRFILRLQPFATSSRTPILDSRLAGPVGVYPPFPAATSPHLRVLFSPAFTASTSASYESLARLLLDLIKLEQSAAPLKSIHLPRVLLTLLSFATEVLQPGFEMFVHSMQKKGADLVYRDEDEDDIWVVSQQFWRFAKELKAREVEEQ